MRVAVHLVVELDAAKWLEYNGTVRSVREVRDDVRSHVLNLAQQSVLLDEADGEVSLSTRATPA